MPDTVTRHLDMAALERCARCGGQLAYRGGNRGVREVACGVCHHPAGADHPLQKELDQQWAERDAREKLAREQANAASPTEYGQAHPLQMLADQVNTLEHRIAVLEAELAALRKEMAAAQKERKR